MQDQRGSEEPGSGRSVPESPHEIVLTVLGIALLAGGIVDQAIDATRLVGLPLPAPGALAGRIVFVLLGLALITSGLAGRWLRDAARLTTWLRDLRRPPDPIVRRPPVLGLGAPAQLPPEIPEFTGRREPLDRLWELVRQRAQGTAPTIIAISGKGGSGKSELAVKFARGIRRLFPDAQLYADFRSNTPEPVSTATVLQRFIRSVTNAPDPDLPLDEEALKGAYRTIMADRRSLIILDNVAGEEQVRPLVPGCQNCLILVTSRHALVGLTGAELVRLEEMSEEESIDLLAAIAGPVVKEEHNRQAAATIAEQCGYLPLALSIAGALIRASHGSRRARPVREVANLLASETQRLAELRVGDRSIRACFDASYVQLSEPLRSLWRRLRLLPDPLITPHLAAELVESNATVIGQHLDELVNAQVLEVSAELEGSAIQEERGPRLYKFHDLIGLYADEKLNKEEPFAEKQAAARRVLQVYMGQSLHFAARLDRALRDLRPEIGTAATTTLADQQAALAWFEEQRLSLIKAVQRAHEMNLHELTWKLGVSLVPFFELRGYVADWSSIRTMAVKAASAIGDLLAEAWTNLDSGRLEWVRNRPDDAAGPLQAALQTSHVKSWRELEARATFTLGQIHHSSPEPHRSRDVEVRRAAGRYQHAYDLFDQLGSVPDQLRVLFAAAKAYHQAGDLDDSDILRLTAGAVKSLKDAREDLWSLRLLGDAESFLGHLHERAGDLEAAGSDHIGSRDTCQTIGFRYGEARALRDIGRVHLEQGSLGTAAEDLEKSAIRFRALHLHGEEGAARLLRGDVLTRLGNAAGAAADWQLALDLFAKAGSARTEEARRRLSSH